MQTAGCSACIVWHMCADFHKSHLKMHKHTHKCTLLWVAVLIVSTVLFALPPCASHSRLNGAADQHRADVCVCVWVEVCVPFQSPHLDGHKNACPERALLLMWLFYSRFHIWEDSICRSTVSLASCTDHVICLPLSFRNAGIHSNLNTACVYTASLVKHWSC